MSHRVTVTWHMHMHSRRNALWVLPLCAHAIVVGMYNRLELIAIKALLVAVNSRRCLHVLG